MYVLIVEEQNEWIHEVLEHFNLVDSMTSEINDNQKTWICVKLKSGNVTRKKDKLCSKN